MSRTERIASTLPVSLAVRSPHQRGKLSRLIGLSLEVRGIRLALGDRILIDAQPRPVRAQVVGFRDDTSIVIPMDDASGLTPGAAVTLDGDAGSVHLGMGLLGRVVDAEAQPIDGLGPITDTHPESWLTPALNPLTRSPINQALDVGVKAINGCLTIGKGQRMGLFAGSGVGKSVLMGMMTRFTEAEIVVVGLIGERGREVREFVEDALGEQGLRKAVVVACPADASPLLRLRSAELATRIAEYFRDQGAHTLMLMDSLTRFAQAQREIGLASGEPPTTKGYPPSVFAKLPALVERAGNSDSAGSLTAIYTVLTEGDDQQDPIADAARAILDGHIVLDRKIAETGQYPAIDIAQSISRVMPKITTPEHASAAMRVKQWLGAYESRRDLIDVGAYQRGADTVVDQAIVKLPAIREFLAQPMNQGSDFEQTQQQLQTLVLG
ncbi:FliI/YscN family ATPase [Litorivicinus lipolyticus]|uniref:Flagellum-specific ATP synthase n=1 Tax=Litorivicinus lipolyticus TaxID=418701 RepID=A0A5Q2QDX7_9GAMM|nr:FliI/YscN family ATPase [Litorivicinus lipolyticus]QGG80236.1 FliI/YscN family ATPase [Litorivicinus lipolyticus]